MCALLLLTIAAAAVGEAAGAAGKVREVALGSDFYDPGRLTIKQGERVRWIWESSLKRHDVAVRRGPERFRSPLQSSGTYTRRFRKAGTFKLYCTQHTMRMTLIVRP